MVEILVNEKESLKFDLLMEMIEVKSIESMYMTPMDEIVGKPRSLILLDPDNGWEALDHWSDFCRLFDSIDPASALMVYQRRESFDSLKGAFNFGFYNPLIITHSGGGFLFFTKDAGLKENIQFALENYIKERRLEGEEFPVFMEKLMSYDVHSLKHAS